MAKLTISQFNADTMTDRINVVFTGDNSISVSVYGPLVESEGGAKAQTKESARQLLQSALDALDAV